MSYVPGRRWFVFVKEGERYAATEVGDEIHVERIKGASGWHSGVTVWTGVRESNTRFEPGYRTLTTHLREETQRRILALVWGGDPSRGPRRRTILDDDLREAIARSEGGNSPPGADLGALWLEQDEREGGDYSVAGVRASWEAGDGGTIYGLGGMHRYEVWTDGEVTFSRSHGRSGVAAAEAAGFRVT
jgi:hypothetical protein